MYDEFKDQANFFIVYIAEAHAVDEWQTESNEEEGIKLIQHTTLNERMKAAELCAERLGLSIPTLVDGIDNPASEAFSAWPERIYITNEQGTIHYRGGQGPYEFTSEEALGSLVELLVEKT